MACKFTHYSLIGKVILILFFYFLMLKWSFQMFLLYFTIYKHNGELFLVPHCYCDLEFILIQIPSMERQQQQPRRVEQRYVSLLHLFQPLRHFPSSLLHKRATHHL